MKKIISPNIEFYATRTNKSENRDKKSGIKDSYGVGFVDAKKKDQSEKDWTPITTLDLYIIDDISEGFEVGKKYKVTFEEI